MKNKLLTVFVFVLLIAPIVAKASVIPVEISAEKSLEWNRKNKTYTASKNVVITQGDIKIESDILTARYGGEETVTDISTIEAKDNVVITLPPYVANGDSAVYNVKTGNAILTGKNLTVTTNSDVMTADNKIEFFSKENKLVAIGNPKVKHELDVITARTMAAYFKKNKNGKMVADKIIAQGRVKITTPKEIVTGQKAVYNPLTKKVILTGGVKIKQGENWLEGTSAIVDMASGISQLLGNDKSKSDGRVKGVFYPKQTEKKSIE